MPRKEITIEIHSSCATFTISVLILICVFKYMNITELVFYRIFFLYVVLGSYLNQKVMKTPYTVFTKI